MKWTLMFFPEGPKITYEDDGVSHERLVIEDLNPENKISFVLWPHQLLIFGFKCIYRSIFRW